MSKPMRRTYELRHGGTEHLRQTGRMSDREVQAWDYEPSGGTVPEVAEETFRDRATLWRSDRRDVTDVWLGEPYDGCETCGLPVASRNAAVPKPERRGGCRQ